MVVRALLGRVASRRCWRRPRVVYVVGTALILVATLAKCRTARTFTAASTFPAVDSLAKRGIGSGLRPRLARLASAEPEEADALMSKAAELKEEAAALEALSAARRRLQEEKAKAQEEEEQEMMQKEAVNLQERLKEVSERLKRAAAFKTPEETQLREEVNRIERRLDEVAEAVRAQEVPESKTEAKASSGGSAPTSAIGDQALLAKRSGSWPETEKMSPTDWVELKRKFEELGFFEQVQTGTKLGPQGRRKLVAMREGTDGVFIVPGEVVKLLEDTEQFKQSFKRFKPNTLNGFNEAKEARRGQECTITVTWKDGTFMCRFADGLVFDFPWESVAGFDMKESGLAL